MKKIVLIFTLLVSLSFQAACPEGEKLLEVFSAGTDDGNKIKITFDSVDIIKFEEQTGDNMGVHLVVFDKLTLAKKLDKYYKLATNGLGNAEENTLLKTDIKAIQTGDYVAVGIKGGAQLMNQEGVDALKTLGADNWPALNVARINFALIGQKDKAAGTAVFNHKYRWSGPVYVQACLSGAVEKLTPICKPGEYFSESQCQPCLENCLLCNEKDQCQQCKPDFIQLQKNQCVANTSYQCPDDLAMINYKCFEYGCLDELKLLSEQFLKGECSEEGANGNQIFKVKISSDQFKMNKKCHYSQKVFRQIKNGDTFENKEEIDKAVVIGDKESSISFQYPFATVLEKCQLDGTDQVNYKYDCYFVITIAVADIEQADIKYKFSVVVKRDTSATVSFAIEKNEINLCKNEECTHYVTVKSKLQNCNADYECSDTLNPTYKRLDHVYIKHAIDDATLATRMYLVPVVVQLLSPGTDIKIKDYTYKNKQFGFITFDIPLNIAIGKATLNVQSRLEATLPALLMLRRVLQTKVPDKKQVIETNVAVDIQDTQPEQKPIIEEPKDEGLSGGAIAGIVIGVIVGVAVLGALGFFGYKYMKSKNVTQKHEQQVDAKAENYQDQNAVNVNE